MIQLKEAIVWFVFMIFFVLLFGLWAIIEVGAQDKTPSHVVREELKTRILRAQLSQTKVQRDFQACAGRNFQTEFGQFDAQIEMAVQEAFKDAKLDRKEYDLNLDTFEFVKKAAVPIPAPPASAKPAEEKKP